MPTPDAKKIEVVLHLSPSVHQKLRRLVYLYSFKGKERTADDIVRAGILRLWAHLDDVDLDVLSHDRAWKGIK